MLDMHWKNAECQYLALVLIKQMFNPNFLFISYFMIFMNQRAPPFFFNKALNLMFIREYCIYPAELQMN